MAAEADVRVWYPRAVVAPRAVQERSPVSPRPPRLLDRVREAIRLRHGSRSTEKSYVGWIRGYILFHGKRHPSEMGAPEITRFLSSLAVEGKVAASTQNQALSALLFLYRHVLDQDLPWLDDVVRARRPRRLPIVLTRDEVRAVITEMHGTSRLMATLLYGAGLRLLECCHLRVQNIDFGTNQIVVRDGKGAKDRVTILPAVAKAALAQHLQSAQRQHEADLTRGAGWVELPWALARKYPNAGRQWPWQWVFPATRFYVDRTTGQRRRHHLHETVLQRTVIEAVRRAPHQAGHSPHLPPLLRDPSARRRPRSPHRSGVARPPRRQHHADLHPCSQPRSGRRHQSRRPRPRPMINRPCLPGGPGDMHRISQVCVTHESRSC